MDDLQAAADRLAAALQRAVYIEDSDFRPLAASSQVGHIDEARVSALLYRGPSEEHLTYFAECGVPRARGPIRIPSNEPLGLLARVMLPIIDGPAVLARIWLIDSRPAVDESEIVQVQEAGEQMRPHLVERNQQSRRGLAIGARLVRGIDLSGMKRREGLLEQLREQYQLADLRGTYACVIRFGTDWADGAPPVGGELLEAVLATFAEPLHAHRIAGYAGDREIRAMISPQDQGSTVLELVRAAAMRAAAAHGQQLESVGVGTAVGAADRVGAAIRQAEFAARIGARVPRFDRAAHWDGLGEYQLFSEIGWGIHGVAALHEGVARLVSDERSDLATTMLAYLEREGDVEATARELNVHRTTLYYRIRRAKETIGEEPVGGARLSIHAALRFAALVGLCASPGTPFRGE